MVLNVIFDTEDLVLVGESPGVSTLVLFSVEIGVSLIIVAVSSVDFRVVSLSVEFK